MALLHVRDVYRWRQSAVCKYISQSISQLVLFTVLMLTKIMFFHTFLYIYLISLVSLQSVLTTRTKLNVKKTQFNYCAFNQNYQQRYIVTAFVCQVPFATNIYGLIGPNGGLGFAIGDYQDAHYLTESQILKVFVGKQMQTSCMIFYFVNCVNNINLIIFRVFIVMIC